MAVQRSVSSVGDDRSNSLVGNWHLRIKDNAARAVQRELSDLRPFASELRDWRDLFEGARPVVERADDDGDYQADVSVRIVSP